MHPVLSHTFSSLCWYWWNFGSICLIRTWHRFGISQASVSWCVNKWIGTMFIKLQPLVRWPRWEELQLTMPVEFKTHFKKCVAISDCFEVLCERSKSVNARSLSWSNYKHHNTVKFPIAITPQGAILFVSKGWGGRASDQQITETVRYSDTCYLEM